MPERTALPGRRPSSIRTPQAKASARPGGRGEAAGPAPRLSPDAVLARSRRLGHRVGTFAISPAGGDRAQRLSVNLQPADGVIQQIVAYAQGTLGITEPVAADEPVGDDPIGVDENVYLYGHGGTSRIDVEANDRFGRRSVEQLVAMLAPRIPADYTGTVYLVGCTTEPLVAGLSAALGVATDQAVHVLGTPEKLQTTGTGGIVLRRAPRTPEVARSREVVDIGRSYYDRFRALRDAFRNARQALRAAHDMGQRTAAVLQVIEALETLKAMNTEIAAGLATLGPEELPTKLKGRREGLNMVKDDLAVLDTQRDALLDLIDLWLPLRVTATNFGTDQETGLAGEMAERLEQARTDLGERIEVLAFFTNVADEVLQGVPFQLEQMGLPAPQALEVESSEEDLSDEDLSSDVSDEETEEEPSSSGFWWKVGLGIGAILTLGAILYKSRK